MAVAFITEAACREGIRLDMYRNVDEQLRAKMQHSEVTCLSLSFRRLGKISNLEPFINLVQLQLDNNNLRKICNLEHLVHLTWLDLSFNQLQEVEGLATLTRLQDLALHRNELKAIDGLAESPSLHTLSLGDNELAHLTCTQTLQKLPKLRSLSMKGNPLCTAPTYRAHLLVHLPELLYLDNVRIMPAEVQTARESMQDVVQELQIQASIQEARTAAAAEAAAASEKRERSHTQGMESMLEDAVKDEADWKRLGMIPDLLKAWPETLNKTRNTVADFQITMSEELEKREDEASSLHSAATSAVQEQQRAADSKIALLAKAVKHAARDLGYDEEEVEATKARLQEAATKLQDELVAAEVALGEDLHAMAKQYEHDVTRLVESCQPLYGSCFSSVRDVLDMFWDATVGTANEAADKYANDTEGIPEPAQELVRDKETLLAVVSGCKESAGAHLDYVQAALYRGLQEAVAAQVATFTAWTDTLKRQRVAEVLHVCKRHQDSIGQLAYDGPNLL